MPSLKKMKFLKNLKGWATSNIKKRKQSEDKENVCPPQSRDASINLIMISCRHGERHAMRSTWVLPAVTNGYSQPYPCHVTTAGRPRAHSQWSMGVLCTLCTTHSWCYIHHLRGAVMPVDGTLYTRSSIYLILYTLYHAGLNLHHVKIFGVPDSTYQYMVYPTPPLKGTQGWCYLHHIHICGVPGTT